MSDQIHWMLEVAVKDGKLDSFKELNEEMVETTQSTEPGTLIYEWLLSEDGSTCHIHERYVDSAATMVHLASFGQNYAERFMTLCDPTRFVVYGNPNDEVRQALADFGPTYMTEIGGFAR